MDTMDCRKGSSSGATVVTPHSDGPLQKITALCLTTVSMNTKHTLHGGLGDTAQQTEIMFSNVTGFMTVRLVVYVIKSD